MSAVQPPSAGACSPCGPRTSARRPGKGMTARSARSCRSKSSTKSSSGEHSSTGRCLVAQASWPPQHQPRSSRWTSCAEPRETTGAESCETVGDGRPWRRRATARRIAGGSVGGEYCVTMGSKTTYPSMPRAGSGRWLTNLAGVWWSRPARGSRPSSRRSLAGSTTSSSAVEPASDVTNSPVQTASLEGAARRDTWSGRPHRLFARMRAAVVSEPAL